MNDIEFMTSVKNKSIHCNTEKQQRKRLQPTNLAENNRVKRC